MSKVATNKRNWLEEVKDDAEKITLRRLKDDGFESGEGEKESVTAAKERAAKAPEAEIVK